MNKTSRWATIISVVCGAELVAAVVIGSAGLAALFSIEAAVIVALLGVVALLTVLGHRRRTAARSRPTHQQPWTTTRKPNGASLPARDQQESPG